MQATLEDIKQGLTRNVYKNEEHVRLSLVCCILDKLGWDVWNPEEVYPEFVPNQREDSTRVDLALFIDHDHRPQVFIETKALGKIDGPALQEVEQQMRNYNRDNNALFSIITDGQKWRFYYALSQGAFADKCFREFDFLRDETSTIEEILTGFLTKKSLQTGAEDAAKKYLRLSQTEKAIQKCLPETTGLMNKPPYYTKPQALVELMKQQGITLTEEQAMEFLAKNPSLPNPNSKPPIKHDLVRGRKSKFAGKRIYKLVKDNPRRKDTHGYKSFNLIHDGMTFEEYKQKGGRNNDLQWDVDRNFVELK